MRKFGMHGSVVKRTISGYDLIRTYIPLIRFVFFFFFTFVAFFSSFLFVSLLFVPFVLFSLFRTLISWALALHNTEHPFTNVDLCCWEIVDKMALKGQ